MFGIVVVSTCTLFAAHLLFFPPSGRFAGDHPNHFLLRFFLNSHIGASPTFPCRYVISGARFVIICVVAASGGSRKRKLCLREPPRSRHSAFSVPGKGNYVCGNRPARDIRKNAESSDNYDARFLFSIIRSRLARRREHLSPGLGYLLSCKDLPRTWYRRGFALPSWKRLAQAGPGGVHHLMTGT